MATPLKVIQVGLGPIGLECVRVAAARPNLEIAGAVDLHPDLTGRHLREFEPSAPRIVRITSDLAELLDHNKPDVALVTTTSRMPGIDETLKQLARAGVDVVSSCEELLFPWHAHPETAEALAKEAERGKATILGTGVNPGFVMDTFAAVATAPCEAVTSIRATRIVDAGTRREPLQRKVGASMEEADFRKLVEQKKIGHVGLVESVALLAHGLGWVLDGIEETLEPKMADKETVTSYLTVRKGEVAGIHHEARGIVGGKPVLELLLEMYVGAEHPHDQVEIAGKPNLTVRIEGGTPGDTATAAIMVNMIPRVHAAVPGLVTMLDLPAPRFSAGIA